MEQDEITERFVKGLSDQYKAKFAALEMAGVEFEILDEYWRVRVSCRGQEAVVSGVFIHHAANNAVIAAYKMLDRVVVS